MVYFLHVLYCPMRHIRVWSEEFLPRGIRHAVGPQRSHYAQPLQGSLVLPFTGQLVSLWCLTICVLLPPNQNI